MNRGQTIAKLVLDLQTENERLKDENTRLKKASEIFEAGSKENVEVFEVLYKAGLVPAEKPGPRLAEIVKVLEEKAKKYDALKSSRETVASEIQFFRELVGSYDYLGTGSNIRAADREASETMARFEALIKQLKVD
jgi:hypothetical protein